MTTAPRIHITANPRIRLQCGCLAHQVFAAENNTATRASIATPWNANRVGWATFQPAALNHGRSPTSENFLFFQCSHSSLPRSRPDKDSRTIPMNEFDVKIVEYVAAAEHI